MKFALSVLVCVLLGWLLTIPAVAALPSVLVDQQPTFRFETHLDFLVDPNGRYTADDVASTALRMRFRNTGEERFNKGFTDDTYWLKVEFENRSSPWQRWYLQLFTEEETPIEVYLQQDDNKPVRLMPEPYFLYHTYPLPLTDNQRYTAYIKIVNRSYLLQCSLRLVQAEQRVNIHRVIFFAIITGCLIALSFYNLFLLINLRNTSYGALGIGILAITLERSRFTGLLHQYMGVNADYYPMYAVFGFIAVAGYVVLLRELFSMQHTMPVLNRVFKWLYWVAVASVLMVMVIPYAIFWYAVLIMISAALTIMTLFRAVCLKSPLNRKVMIAFLWLTLGGIPSILMGVGVSIVFPYEVEVSLLAVFLFSLMLSLVHTDHVRSLREEAASAGAASKAKGDFLTTMSHELRTPMNAVVGASTLLRQSILDKKQSIYVEKLEVASQHMLALIGNILDFSHMEQKELSLVIAPFSLQLLIVELRTLFAIQAENKKLNFTVQCNSIPNSGLLGDVVRVKQVLINLLSNAFKFTEQGGVTLIIQNQEGFKAGQVVIQFAVVDTGIGIAVAEQEKLFQPFSQLHNSSSPHYGGSGLGLVISQRLIKQMGGALELNSIEKCGSRFQFSLSFSLVDLPPAVTDIDHKYQTTARILLVDDDPLNQFFVAELLRTYGVHITVANNGQQAIQQIQAQTFELVFMDVSMPILNGYETVQRIRRFKSPSELPIIALTAHAIVGERERCLASGMNDFLTKPFAMEDLRQILQRWLN